MTNLFDAYIYLDARCWDWRQKFKCPMESEIMIIGLPEKTTNTVLLL